jgi:DnaJ like chaperone protein
MSWMGKILGGGLGFVIAGPLGAVLGAVIGHHTMDAREGFSSLESKQGIYFAATFSMLGKLAKADGMVTPHEIEVIERVMRDNLRLSPDARQFAIDIFNVAKDSEEKFEDFAGQFYTEFGSSPEMLGSLIELLLLVAYADGDFHDAEEAMILEAVRIFGLTGQYHQLKSRFTGVPGDIGSYYEILGCKKGDELTSVKKKYRKLAMEYHPDRVQSKGMPPEFAQAAEDKFKEVQHAYDMVEKHIAGR